MTILEKVVKAKKFACKFKGISTIPLHDDQGFNEFNESEGDVIAFSLDGAIFQWLKEMWDCSLSVNIPYSSDLNTINYGQEFAEFISSKDVEFKIIESNKRSIVIEFRYNGYDNYFYSISAESKE